MTDQGQDRALHYNCCEYPIERRGVRLHLDCVKQEGTAQKRNILLIHGMTHSSHIFDVAYRDYSLVRRLAQGGYAVWRLDIAGFGRSGAVADGFLPDSCYAAEDIHAAAEMIVQTTGQEKIDLLGWSWGTVTTGRFAVRYPEHLNRLVLYAPILRGIGYTEITEPYHHDTWEQAAEDFQRCEDGTFDTTVTDPVVIEMFCSGCWHYDGEYSPNGGRREICAERSKRLIETDRISVPTMIICGDRDPYVDYELINRAAEELPEGSRLEIIPGGTHAVFLEAPFYRDFQERLIRFLNIQEYRAH